MTALLVLLGVVALILVALYLWWRARYGYVREGEPQVLCYHKLSQRFCFEGTWATPRQFVRHIDALCARGYTFVDEDTFFTRITGGGSEERQLLLTFDDGYENIYETFMKELAPRGIPVLVFLLSDYIGEMNSWDLSLGRRPFRHLSEQHVREMASRGASFGSHGPAHDDLTRVGGEECRRQLVQSKATIERVTGRPVRSFSYPFGRYNDAVRESVKQAGYDMAFSLYPKHPNHRRDAYALRRNGVYIIDNVFTLARKLEPKGLYWLEEMKCRVINGVAVLTPVLKRLSAGRGT